MSKQGSVLPMLQHVVLYSIHRMLETRTSLRAGVATGSYQIGKSHVITAITALAHRDIEVALILQQLPEVADVPPGEAVGVKAQVRLVRTGEAPHRMLASMALLAPSTWLTLATFVRYSTENVWRWAGMQREIGACEFANQLPNEGLLRALRMLLIGSC